MRRYVISSCEHAVWVACELASILAVVGASLSVQCGTACGVGLPALVASAANIIEFYTGGTWSFEIYKDDISLPFFIQKFRLKKRFLHGGL